MGAGEQLLPFYLGRMSLCSAAPSVFPLMLYSRDIVHMLLISGKVRNHDKNTRSLVRLVIKEGYRGFKKAIEGLKILLDPC